MLVVGHDEDGHGGDGGDVGTQVTALRALTRGLRGHVQLSGDHLLVTPVSIDKIKWACDSALPV